MVGIYTPSDLQRKLDDLAGMDTSWCRLVSELMLRMTPAEFRKRLEEWFLRSAQLTCRHPDVLDPPGAIDSFISDHYRAVENVGSSVLMRRISSP